MLEMTMGALKPLWNSTSGPQRDPIPWLFLMEKTTRMAQEWILVPEISDLEL